MHADLSPTPLRTLRLLAWLRFGAAGLQAGVVATVYLAFDPALPWAALFAVPALLTAFNLGVWWRLRRRRAGSNLEVLLHLGLDCLALTVLLWLSGGAGNPFTSLFLLPIGLAAVALPAGYAWLMAAVCTLLYGLLFLHPTATGVDHRFFALHVWGMGANFVLGATLLTAGLTALAGLLRQREQALAEAREDILRHEQIVAAGIQAAGTAHELSTPLSTMAVLIADLRERARPDTDTAADLELLEEQIALCKQRLGDMLSAADPGRHGRPRDQALRDFLDDTFNRWLLLRPETDVAVTYAADFENPRIQPEPLLAQALGSLLDNAADASAEAGSDRLDVACASDGIWLRIRIDDEGPGLSADQVARAGRGFFTTKPHGFGLGLVLSHASLSRLDGEVRLLPRNAGGTRTEIDVPLARLRAKPADTAAPAR